MALVTYHGFHPEPSITVRIPKDGHDPVKPFGVIDPSSAGSKHNEVCCFPAGIGRKVPCWVGVYLAGIRRRHGPWFTVRLSREEWREIRTRAPWIIKAKDAVILYDAEILKGLYAQEMRAVRVNNWTWHPVIGWGGEKVEKEK